MKTPFEKIKWDGKANLKKIQVANKYQVDKLLLLGQGAFDERVEARLGEILFGFASWDSVLRHGVRGDTVVFEVVRRALRGFVNQTDVIIEPGGVNEGLLHARFSQNAAHGQSAIFRMAAASAEFLFERLRVFPGQTFIGRVNCTQGIRGVGQP